MNSVIDVFTDCTLYKNLTLCVQILTGIIYDQLVCPFWSLKTQVIF